MVTIINPLNISFAPNTTLFRIQITSMVPKAKGFDTLFARTDRLDFVKGAKCKYVPRSRAQRKSTRGSTAKLAELWSESGGDHFRLLLAS